VQRAKAEEAAAASRSALEALRRKMQQREGAIETVRVVVLMSIYNV
jgi:hypothetical protein